MKTSDWMRSPEERGRWNFIQCFGDKNETNSVNEVDILSSIAFSKDGRFLASGDRGGRVVVFERNGSGSCDYRYATEIQSHDCEFDYLKSVFIEERIGKLRWCDSINGHQFLLAANEKCIKLWKFTPPRQHFAAGEGEFSVCNKQTFPSVHAYHINSLSLSCDGETFLSGDDLRINIWNLNHPNTAFTILDTKPPQLEQMTEVLTTAEFHPSSSFKFTWGTSRGALKVADLRSRCTVSKPSIVMACDAEKEWGSIFGEMLQGISSFTQSSDGNRIIARDFMTLITWDVRSPLAPVRRYPVHEYLTKKLCDLYETENIYDKFDLCASADGTQALTGSYGNNFFIYDCTNDSAIPFEAHRPALKRRLAAKGSDTSVKFTSNPESSAYRLFSPVNHSIFPAISDSFCTERKVLHAAWHPQENVVAVAATNMLYIFSQQQPGHCI